MKLSFCTLVCPEWSLRRIIDSAKKYDYQGVDLRVGAGHRHGVSIGTGSFERKKIKKLFKNSGIEISCVATPFSFSQFGRDERTTMLARLEDYTKLTADLGSANMRIFAGKIPQSQTKEDYFQYIADILLEAVQVSPIRGVHMLLETHDSVSLGRDLATVLNRAKSEYIGAIWDIAHPVVHGEPVEQTFNYLRGRIHHVHIKDFAYLGEKRTGNPYDSWEKWVPLGKGNLPISEVMQIMKNSGFSGYFSLEEMKGDVEQALIQSSRKLRNYWRNLS